MKLLKYRGERFVHVTKAEIILTKPLDVCVKCGTMYMTIMTSVTSETIQTPKR